MLIGNIGGTLGLFVGFSFMGAYGALVHLLKIVWVKWKPISTNLSPIAIKILKIVITTVTKVGLTISAIFARMDSRLVFLNILLLSG